MEFLEQYPGNFDVKGPGKCLCQPLKEGKMCEQCSQVQTDWEIYHAMQDIEKLPESQIVLDENKIIPIGQMKEEQVKALQEILKQNQDLFAASLSELKQTNVGEHAIITE